MNALKCRTLTRKHTPEHEQKLSLKSITIEQCVGVPVWQFQQSCSVEKYTQIAKRQSALLSKSLRLIILETSATTSCSGLHEETCTDVSIIIDGFTKTMLALYKLQLLSVKNISEIHTNYIPGDKSFQVLAQA